MGAERRAGGTAGQAPGGTDPAHPASYSREEKLPGGRNPGNR